MKIYYITLNKNDEAIKISQELLKNKFAVCTNWFPINCAYLWEGEIKQGTEIVLIVKTLENMRDSIEKVISQHIAYTNFIAEIPIDSVNATFQTWIAGSIGRAKAF